MRYTAISDAEFNNRYQLLDNYIKVQTNAGISFPQIRYELNNLPNGHALKGKKFSVLNLKNRKSFLHKAAAAGNLLFIRFLKEGDPDLINRQDAQHKTPLYDACAQLKLAAADALLGYGADPDLGNGHITTPVEHEGVTVDFTGEKVPLVATIESKATVTAAELSAATGEDFSQLTTEDATEQAAAKIVKSLIAKGAEIDLQTGLENFSALHRSIINLKPLIVKEISDSVQADPIKKDKIFTQVDRDDQTALHMVVDYRNEDEKPKEQVQMQKEKQITELIIPNLKAINIKDKNGNTPLITAVDCSNADVVAAIYKNDYLFSQEKVLSIKNDAGDTALLIAIKEAKRGPKVLAILLRVATVDDLAITNNQGENAKQLATRLINEAKVVEDLAKEVTAAADELESLLGSDEIEQVSASPEIKQLQEAIEKLDAHLEHSRATNRLSVELEGLSLDTKDHAEVDSLPLTDIEDLISRARQITTDTQKEFYHEDYLKSLKSVHQLEYTAWKTDILNKPSSFPNLDIIDTQSAAYQRDIGQAYDFFNLGERFLSVNDNVNARVSIESAIPIYARLKNNLALERCYQSLAKTYIGMDDGPITRYETENQNKLHSSNNQEKLQGHFALAGLYKELREQNFVSPSFSSDALQAHESYHYYQAYKLTQGALDDDADVVLQHEMGIIYREKLGTYNIQQCVAVVAFDKDRITGTGKVVLSHFDRYSGPLSFIENLLKEFPGQNKIHLYMMGGRDRLSLVSPTTSTTKISDNNIDQVLKQIYAEQDRFVIEAADLGGKPCPEAVVFDVFTEQLVHATPNRADSSLPSREVNFFLQKSKADYLRPLNKVDFSQPLADRTVHFTAGEQLDILQNARTFSSNPDQTAAWNHQKFYPLMTIENEIMGTPKDFKQGLLKKAFIDRYQGPSILNNLACIGGKHRRDAGPCELDSKRVLEDLVELPEAEQSAVLEHVATRRVGGTKQKEVATLVHNRETTSHLQKAGGISSALTKGLFAEDAIAGLVKGDPSLAMQFGSIEVLGRIVEKAAAYGDAKGLEWLAEGKLLRGTALRAGSHMASRLGWVMAASDLYTEVGEYQKNPNNTAAVVGIVTDGIQISADLFAGGVEVIEISSETFAALGISAVTGPAAAIVGGIVMLGSKIYGAVTKVNGEDHLLHLSTREKWIEGALAFLSLNSTFQKELDEITEYERIVLKQLEFLQKHPEIKHVIFPAIEKIGESCRMVIGKHSCSGGGLLFPPTCTNEEEVWDPIFATVNDSSVYLADKLVGFSLIREEITPPEGSELLCVPTGNGKSLPVGGAYACDGALGLSSKNATGTATYYDLGEGRDHAAGFVNSSNIFMVNDGAKDYAGGDLEDIFIINAKEVVTAVIEGEIGGLDGGAGSDSLLLQGFQPAADRIEVNLLDGYLQYGNKTLAITNIEKISGGTFPLAVTAASDTQEIHLAGGPTLGNLDTLFIPKNSNGTYDLKMYLQPPVNVNNEAEVGNFTYYILPGKGKVAVNLTATEDSPNTQHQFVFNAFISDVSSIAFSATALKLHFLDHRIRKLLRTLQDISFIKTNATVNATIAYHLKPNSALNLTRFELSSQLAAAQTREILKKYLVNQAADSFNVTLNKPHEIRHAVLNLLNKVDNENVEDFKFELNASLNNTSFQFIDNAELKIGNINFYLFQQNLTQGVSEIMGKYAPIARRLNLICILKTQDNQQITIGHNGKEVMENNPSVKTHLNGNGGEAVFVIKSGMEVLSKSQLPIKDVTIYRLLKDTQIDSLDLRELNKQVRLKNATATFRFIVPNKRNKLGFDLKLRFGMQEQGQDAVIPIVTIYFEKLRNHWHKKYLHIFLDDKKPQQIAGRHTHLYLKPLPLKFGLQHKIAVVSVNDVAENTPLEIRRAYQEGAFFHHNKTNLLWTNTLSNSSNNRVVPFTLILRDFYQESELFKTLFLQFSDRKITLKNKLAEINSAEDFEVEKDSLLTSLEAGSSAILNSTQLALHPTSQPTNASEIDVSQDQEHYIDNEVNATSIEEDHTDDYSGEEANEIDLFRRRRSAEISDSAAATSSASRLQSWIYFPRKIVENVVHTAGEIFNHMGSNIMNLNLLNQSPILGNKTSSLNNQPNPIQEYTLDAQDTSLKKCVSLKLVDIDQEPIEGVSCSIPDAKINFFHNIPFETCPAAFEQPGDNFANCRPVEWYGRPSVVCEGAKTTAIVTPHLPPRIFDSVDGWLMLGQLTVAIANKLFSKPVTDMRYQLVDEFSIEQALLWQTKLTAMENQLQGLQTRVDMQQLKWIQYRLEDRQEEFDQFKKRNRITWNEITEFTKNLFELEEMLDEVEEQPLPTSSSFQQRDNDVFARAASSGNHQNNAPQADAATFVSTERLAQGSFGLTRFSGFFSSAANQSDTALLNGSTQTQEVLVPRLHS
jgi:ankyrin repeat protein